MRPSLNGTGRRRIRARCGKIRPIGELSNTFDHDGQPDDGCDWKPTEIRLAASLNQTSGEKEKSCPTPLSTLPGPSPRLRRQRQDLKRSFKTISGSAAARGAISTARSSWKLRVVRQTLFMCCSAFCEHQTRFLMDAWRPSVHDIARAQARFKKTNLPARNASRLKNGQ